MTRVTMVAIFLVLATATPVSAQQADCLSLPETLAIIAERDPTIGLARAEQAAAQARLTQVRSEWRPQLSSYARAAQGEVGLVSGRGDNQAGLILSQRVFDFGQGKYRQTAARARVTAADHSIAEADATSRLDAAETFLQVLESRERLEAANSRAQRFGALAEGVNQLLDPGLITLAEARSIEAENAAATASRIEEAATLDAALSRLAIYSGISRSPCPDSPEIDAFLARNLPAAVDVGPVLSGELVEDNPEIRIAKAMRDAALADLEVARRAQRPAVDLQGVTAYRYDDFENRWVSASRIGIELTMPIFGSGKYSGGRAEARAQLTASDLEIERLRRELLERTTTTQNRIAAFDELARARAAALSSQRAEVDAIEREFERGLRTFQDFIRAKAELALSEVAEIEARYAARKQRLILLALTDTLPTDEPAPDNASIRQ